MTTAQATTQRGQYPYFIAFFTSAAMSQDLVRLCALTGRNRSEILRQALDQFLRSELPYRLLEKTGT